MNTKIRIYSFYYRNMAIPFENPVYVPVMAGKKLNTGPTWMEGDDTGDSISDKNLYFSELTGIYWVWKNTRQDLTGCCHYRRYFTAQKEPLDLILKRKLYFLIGLYKKRYGLIYTKNIQRFAGKVLGEQEILDIFQNHDAILPQPRKLKYSVQEHYRRYHKISDLVIIRKILAENHPEYLQSFQNMLESKRLYANNMFVLPQQTFYLFMEWWFNVLFEFEKRVELSEYGGYQQRILGFIAERLLTTWFLHQNLKVKELPVLYFKNLKFRK